MLNEINFQEVEVLQSEIIFKQINPEDFTPDGYEAEISRITPTPEGYISEQVKSVIDFEETNTVVLNAGVGQGKTHTILDIAKWYYDNNYIVIFAVPYKSLIDQYLNDLTGNERNISADEVVDYRKITESPNAEIEGEIQNPITPIAASLKPIHLITVNSLLGNPGEDFVIQAQAKLNYINLLISHCKNENKKAILIFDEIHDSIHLFEQRFILTLYNWNGLIKKIYCISATYNEASKIVIKYLSHLTNAAIQIIESERIKFEFKQSDLFLLLYNKQHYEANDEDLISVFRHLVFLGKRINVLSFSKTLANNIVDPKGKIGKLLIEKFGELNLCVGNSDTIFDPEKCNVGTTFSTGINIKGNDSAFVVILPSKLSYDQNQLGVFSRGINTLIQALARIRDKSEIYIITPSPKFLLNYLNQNNENYIDKVILHDTFYGIEQKDKYRDINTQRELINETYLRIKNNALSGIEFGLAIDAGEINNPALKFPSLDDYILSEGEKVLKSYYEIFGKDFSIYTFWAAFNDQFINCRLKGIAVLNELYLTEGQVLNGLRDFVYNKFYEFTPLSNYSISEFFHLKSDKACFQALKAAIFNNNVYKISNNIKIPILEGRTPTFKRYILAIIQLIKKDNEYYNNLFYRNYQRYSQSLGDLIDVEYTAKDYLFACFINSERTDFSESTTDDEKRLVASYKVLYLFFRRFKERFTTQDDMGRFYFDVNTNLSTILSDEINELKSAIIFIQEKDEIVSKKIVSFFQGINSSISNERLLLSIIRFYKKTFFESRVARINLNGETDNRRDVIVNEYLPPNGNLLNMLFTSEFEWLEDNHGMDGIVESISYSPDHPEADI